MSVFPGECEECGGPQQWTIYAGVTFVRCEKLCSRQLVMPGFDLPSDSEDPGHSFARDVESRELGSEWEVVPLEGAADKMSDSKEKALEDPPRAFLDSLWQGGWDG